MRQEKWGKVKTRESLSKGITRFENLAEDAIRSAHV